MANEQNLKALSPSEARENGKKGGLKSGEARRARRKLRDELDALLSADGMSAEICLALVQKAKNGDVRAFEMIRDTLGEKPVDKVASTDAQGRDPAEPDLSKFSDERLEKLLKKFDEE